MSLTLASEQEWNRLRNAFTVSLMAETPLSSLVQNLEAGDWPLKGADETPSKYVVYSWDELQRLPVFVADPALLELLLRVLNDTLSFDEPFQEMVETSQKSIATEYSAIKALVKLQIPEEFPIALTSLSPEAKDLCKSQGFRTLGEYVRLSQKISQLIIMEGDIRAFLNALAHVDEATIARYLPFRPGTKGLHLAEAIGALLRAVPQAELYALAKAIGYRALTAEQGEKATAVSKTRMTEIQATFRTGFLDLLTWFKEEAQDWRQHQEGNQSLTYRFRALNDPLLEAVALGLTHSYFTAATAPTAAAGSAATASGAAATTATIVAPAAKVAAPAAPEEKPSLWGRLRRIFGK